jgi:hypothetical protein
MHPMLRLGKRIGIAIGGGLVILVGAVLSLPLVPGPGLALILLGLFILSLEFERPRTWLVVMKAKALELKQRVADRRAKGRRSP